MVRVLRFVICDFKILIISLTSYVLQSYVQENVELNYAYSIKPTA
jgi:hypothetical protein